MVRATAPGDPDRALGSELRRGGFIPGDGTIDLHEVMNGVIAIVETLAARSGTRVEASFPSALPPAVGDRTIIRQVLLSVLSYVIETEPRTHLIVDAVSRSGETTVQVWSRRIDHPSYSSSDGAQSTSEADELLAVGQHLAKLHGLDVRVNLPTTSSVSDYPIVEVCIPTANPVTVLVVDDNPDVAQLFERFLSGQAYRILKAKTWQQALELAETAQPDIISLDVMMPSQDGWDIHQRLKAHPKLANIPVIICSVLPERALSLAMGATAFLPKPITRQNLLGVLQDCRPARR
jgi:CheY-like chemotaxis protein